ncbi:integrase catalytic domain-containing protein [Nephila pilipes]|uniref:Integrase catalytic domain-containing protein n=1 Tax=Nephila pilipes TaxID=299642 RepID=A0A8X6M711_NEPPI|nr:integrase catalytic domain-containing protein [Nephila pilipes]
MYLIQELSDSNGNVGSLPKPSLQFSSKLPFEAGAGKYFPLASSALLKDVYMDYVLSGADNLSKSKDTQQQFISLLDRGGMELHRWSANNQFIINTNQVFSKRAVLTQIARIIYSLGLLSLIIAKAKVVLQKLWLLKLDGRNTLPLWEKNER